MLSKEYIKQIKQHTPHIFPLLIEEYQNNVGSILFILKNLGNLPKNFRTDWIEKLLQNDNEQVRFWAVKTLGKVENSQLLDLLNYVVLSDSSTIVKREAVSSIGRMRDPKIQTLLLQYLQSYDPKIICQAIRGLLPFKGQPEIDNALRKLVNHENEMVRSVIYKEYFTQKVNKKTLLPHTETYPFLKNVVVNSDVRDVLQLVPEDSVHLTFTSPPYYNARDYSIYPSYEAYLVFLQEVFKEIHRITKEGRFLIVNTSPVIVPRISRAHSSKRYPIPFDLHHRLIQIGWEFIDDIVWMKPEYSVKNRIGGFQQHRKPLAYKPNSVTEYLMVYRKQTDRLLDWNMNQYDKQTVEESKVADGFETTNVWQIHPKSDKVHSAIFPADLCKRIVEYYSFKDDLVFDPFGGSGTLGRVAKKLGRHFFLTEKDEKYFEYMQTFQKKDSLFLERDTKFLTLTEFAGSIIK